MKEKSPFSGIDQVGIVVRDLDKAIEYYQSLGIGPFQSHKANYVSRELKGHPIDSHVVTIKVAVAKIGNIEFELIQPVAHGPHWMDFLETKGEGVQHIGFHVNCPDGIDREEVKLAGKGLEIIYKSRVKRDDGSVSGAMYLDTSRVGGVLFETHLRPPTG